MHLLPSVFSPEEKIDEMIERKKEVAERVVGTREGWLADRAIHSRPQGPLQAW